MPIRWTTIFVIALGVLAGCSSKTGGTFQGGGQDAGGTGFDLDASAQFGDGGAQSDGNAPQVTCDDPSCPNHGCTQVSGTVYDPAGKNPLYDVTVFAPSAPLDPFPAGATCTTCDGLISGKPVASAITDAAGHFTLDNVPAGTNVPIVVQVGKWRKTITVPTVTKCQNTALPNKSVTLPKNHGEGDIPNIAIATDSADTLECLLRRVGLDAAEYGPGSSGSGRIHIFQGDGYFGGAPNTNPAAPDPAASLWNTKSNLMQYDIVLLSCEGHETTAMNQQALFDYAAAGGRVFASHFHYAWFDSGPFGAAKLATWSTGSNHMGDISANIVTTLPNNQPFPKGVALKQWLGNTGALVSGELPITMACHNSDVGASNTASQSWIDSDQNANPPGATEYFSFDTPLNVTPDKQCGRVVFSDLHVGAASADYSGQPLPIVPSGCANNDLSPQEKALEFMLFDLSACVIPNDQPPQPPPVN